MAIDLNYQTNQELFNEEAKKYAEKIGTGVKNTQMRKFYDYVLEYNIKSKNISNEDFKSDILPFIKMLNSKVAYASTRSSGSGKLVNKAFVDMIEDCIRGVSEKKDLENFKLFFEAVIGFHKGNEGQRKNTQGGKR